MSESLEARVKRLQEQKLKTGSEQKLVDEFTGVTEEKKDFSQIAQELQARKEEMVKGKNENHVKDTIYVRKDIYDAIQALCVKQGDKKRIINQALAEFIEREYKRLQSQE